jgi:chromate transporter
MLFQLFYMFFKIGLFTFGGGYAMIPLIHRYIVEDKKWIGNQEFIDIIAIAQSTPGPIAVNTATYVGYKAKGIKGAIIATLGVVLPSIIIIILISVFFMQYKDNPNVEFAFNGVRIGVSILILNAAFRLYKNIDKNYFSYFLVLLGFGMILFNLLPVIYVILIAGAVGIIYQVLIHRNEVDPDA